MEDTVNQIKAAVMNGLSKNEIEALLSRKLDPEETIAYNKTKAILKLQAKREYSEEKEKQGLYVSTCSGENENKPISERWTEEEVIKIVYRTHGLTSGICAALDCSYFQWVVYLRKRPHIKEAQDKSRAQMVDLAEEKLLQNLNSGDDGISQRAAEFILRRMGSSRGWGDSPVSMQQINIEKEKVSIKQIFGLPEQ